MKDDQTVEAYDRYAQVYDSEVVEFWQNFPPTFIDAFAKGLPGNRILNLGSGSGRDAVLLRERGLEVVCVDASSSMVEMTTNLGFESHLSSFSSMRFETESFDGAWAYTSLIHLPKDEAATVIAKIHSFLKPGGVFAIGVIKGDGAGMVERRTMPGVARYFKEYSSEELRALIEPLGFEYVSEETYKPRNTRYLNHLYKRIG